MCSCWIGCTGMLFFFFQAEDGIRDVAVTGVQTCALPILVGQPVIFTANVSAVAPGSGTPTGTVSFKDGAITLATRALSAGAVTYTNSALTVGDHPITAVYNGTNSFNTSTSDVVSQTVNQANTTTTLASSFNPSVFGASVTFTATVAVVSPGGGTPAGTVAFVIDGGTPTNVT